MTRRALAALRRIMLAAALVWLASSLVAANGAAQEPLDSPSPAVLDKDEQASLQRIEDYLNAIDSLRANFVQIAPDGGAAEGTFYLRRPGRVRVEYQPPTPILIVGDGILLHYHDMELGQVNDWPIFDTPLGALSRDQVRFGEELVIAAMERRSGAIAVTVFESDDPGQGTLTLLFTESPLALKQWRVIDAQGLMTTVALFDLEINPPLNAKLFEFDDPRERPIRR
jgi:outer membrane lipoprotein-sorting protein